MRNSADHCVRRQAESLSNALDFHRLGAFEDYRRKDSLKYYGISKLLQCVYAIQLSRRLNPAGTAEVAVHAMCPGGIASNIARNAPALLKPVVNPLLRHFLKTPEEAVGPAIYLCCAEEAGSAAPHAGANGLRTPFPGDEPGLLECALLAPMVAACLGAFMRRGFGDVAEGLKADAEAIHAGIGTEFRRLASLATRFEND